MLLGIMLPVAGMLTTPSQIYAQSEAPLPNTTEEVDFVRSLDLDKLENLLTKMEFVPFNRYDQVKPAKVDVETKDLADLAKLCRIHARIYLTDEITNENKFQNRIASTSRRLGYQNPGSKDIAEFIRWHTNLVRYWGKFYYLMYSKSGGIGLDVDGDGIGDKLKSYYFSSLSQFNKDFARRNPKKFVEFIDSEEKRIDKVPLDERLEQSRGHEGELQLICRNFATANEIVYMHTKDSNPNLKNTFAIRVYNSNHMWNIFATVNEEGIFVTSVDPTFSDDSYGGFSLDVNLDHSYERDGFLWEKGHLHLITGEIFRRNGFYEEAWNLFSEFLKNNKLDELGDYFTIGVGDTLFSCGRFEEASEFYKKSYESYATYQAGYSLFKVGKFEESNQALEQLLRLYNPNSSGGYESDESFDEALPLSGLNYFNLKDYDHAIQQFQLNLKINSLYRDLSLFWLYKCHSAKGDEVNARKALEELNRQFPKFNKDKALEQLNVEMWY